MNFLMVYEIFFIRLNELIFFRKLNWEGMMIITLAIILVIITLIIILINFVHLILKNLKFSMIN
jgi:hypothetical protein